VFASQNLNDIKEKEGRLARTLGSHTPPRAPGTRCFSAASAA
jgi:hypothetical protein